MTIDRSSLRSAGTTIRDETVAGANTALRVGGAIRNIADNLQATGVDTIAEIESITTPSNGLSVFHRGLRCLFTFDSSTNAVTDGITCLEADDSTVGKWLRSHTVSPHWQQQQEWYIHPTNGDDEAVGDDEAPIQTWEEFRRRVGEGNWQSDVQVNWIGGDDSQAVRGDFILQDSAQFRVIGTPTVTASGQFTSGTAQVPASNQRQVLNDTGATFTGLEGQCVRITSGAASGAVAFIVEVLSATSIVTTGFSRETSSTSTTLVTPVGDETYEVLSFPQAATLDFSIHRRSEGGGFITTDVFVEYLEFTSGLSRHRLISNATFATAHACRFIGLGLVMAPSSQFDACHIQVAQTEGTSGSIRASLFTNEFTTFLDFYAVNTFVDQNTMFFEQGVHVHGKIRCYTAGFSSWNSATAGVRVLPGGVVDITTSEFVWGAGNVIGVDVRAGGRYVYDDTAQVITGTTADCRLGAGISSAGVTFGWGLAPRIHAASDSAILDRSNDAFVITETAASSSSVSVPSIAELAALAAPENTTTAYHTGLRDFFIFDSSLTTTTDDLNIIVADDATPGRWVRSQNTSVIWQMQTEWYIDFSAGDDEDAGSSGSPIKTWDEFRRRVGVGNFTNDVTIYIVNGDPSINLDGHFICRGTASLVIEGTPTTSRSSTLTGAVAINQASNQAQEVSDSVVDWTNDLLSRVRLTSGAGADSIAWVAVTTSGTTQVRTSPFCTQSHTGVTQVTPVGDETYVVEDLPTIGTASLRVERGDSNLSPISVSALTIRHLNFDGSLAALTASSSDFVVFFGCSFDLQYMRSLDGTMIFSGCFIDVNAIVGFRTSWKACLVAGSSVQISDISNELALSNDVLFQGRGIASTFHISFENGSAAFYGSSPAIKLLPSAKCSVDNNAYFYGASSGVALQLEDGSRFIYHTTKPTITGTIDLGETGLVVNWTDAPIYDVRNGCGVYDELSQAKGVEELWRLQDTWYINSSTGSDSNTGAGSGTAIRTWAELLRRVGHDAFFPQSVTINIPNGLSTGDIIRGEWTVDGVIVIQGGVVGTLATGTFTGVTATDETAENWIYADTSIGDFAAYEGQVMRITAGVRQGAVAPVGKALTATTTRSVAFIQQAPSSFPVSPALGTAVTALVGDAYAIQSLASVDAVLLTVTHVRQAAASTTSLLIKDCFIRQINGSSAITRAYESNVSFSGCKIGDGSSNLEFLGNFNLSGCALTPGGSTYVQFSGGALTQLSSIVSFGLMSFRDTEFTLRDSLVQDGSLSCSTSLGTLSRIGVWDSDDSVAAGIAAIYLGTRSTLRFTDDVWGEGHTGTTVAIELEPGCHGLYSVLPAIVASGGDVDVAGSIVAYGALPHTNADRLAMMQTATFSEPEEPAGNPHPFWAALDLDTLPGDGGMPGQPYEVPTLPTTNQTITILTSGAQAVTDIKAAAALGNVEIIVPDSAGHLGAGLELGNYSDVDITFGPNVTCDGLSIGALPGEGDEPCFRIRIRGGHFGSLFAVGGSTDLVFDGVIFNNGIIQDPGGYHGRCIDFGNLNRVVIVNCVLRTIPFENAPGDSHGRCFVGEGTNVLFAGNNIVTSGNHDSWGFRISGGGNFLIVDNVCRVPYHKLVRINDNFVDYVYIKGGLWLRGDTDSFSGAPANDLWAQLDTGGAACDHIYIEDTEVYMLSDQQPAFGQLGAAYQSGRIWETTNVHFHALNSTVISDTYLQQLENDTNSFGALSDYGIGTHTYSYDPALEFPADPWLDLPTITTDDPDTLPNWP